MLNEREGIMTRIHFFAGRFAGPFTGMILVLSALSAWAGFARVHENPGRSSFVAYPAPRSYFEAHVNLLEPERPRIQRHLADVEAILRARPVAGLTETQRRNRLARLDDLHAYWTRGEFPRNRDFPDRLVPYFIDARGVPCAMGYLVIRSGGKDYAEEIRDTRNNAYIGEIAAVDSRLAAWTKAQGMTLEEAAMVQPTYGGPVVDMQLVRVDGLARPWILGPRRGDASIGGTIAVYDSARWKFQSEFASGFCLKKDGLPLILTSSYADWKGRSYSLKSPYACEWSPNDSDAWIGSQQGLVRLRRTGSADTLARTLFTTPAGSSDTVTGVALATGAVWAATPRGIYRRGASPIDTATVQWDSTVLGGRRVTGIKAGQGAQVWAGVEGTAFGSRVSSFSTRGILRYNGSSWTRYVAAMSSVFVPGDTVLALAVRDTATAWVAVRSGFYRFPSTGGQTGGKVADIPAGVMVYDLAGTATGFYAGTSNGLYQFRNDSLVYLGPTPSPVRPAVVGRAARSRPALRVLTAREAANTPGAVLSVLGQKTGPQAGVGVYLVRPEAKAE